MHAGICRLAQQTGLHLKVQVQVGSNSGKLHLPDLARCPGVSLIQRYWRNQTTTFQRLVNCNVGLVPNALDVETPTRSSLKANHSHAIAIPHIAYQWKTSANGGRAMVFAQVGLPFIADPEFEVISILVGASLPPENYLASSQDEWAQQLQFLLFDARRRANAAAALRRYAERELVPEKFALPLHERIRELQEKPQAASPTRAAKSKDEGRAHICFTFSKAEYGKMAFRSMSSIVADAADPKRIAFHLFSNNISLIEAPMATFMAQHPLISVRIRSDSELGEVTKYRRSIIAKLSRS